MTVGLERRERRMAEEAIMKRKSRKDRTYELVCTENLGRKTELMRVSERAVGRGGRSSLGGGPSEERFRCDLHVTAPSL